MTISGVKNNKLKLQKTLIFGMGVFLVLIGLLFFLKGLNEENLKKSEWNFAIIPHFMLDSGKVDQFYNFLNNEYFAKSSGKLGNQWNKPDKIILISPNHFHSETGIAKTICSSDKVNYKLKSAFLDSNLADLGVDCDKEEKVFFSWGKTVKTNEHGIGEHFQWIEKYFPDTKVLPIIMPCFNYANAESVLPAVNQITGNVLVVASVDFAHYQPEKQTFEHDEESIRVLESGTLDKSDFYNSVDADCPACLYLLQNLANQKGKNAKLRRRDSSSTILSRDMWEENTSRIFMRYK